MKYKIEKWYQPNKLFFFDFWREKYRKLKIKKFYISSV